MPIDAAKVFTPAHSIIKIFKPSVMIIKYPGL